MLIILPSFHRPSIAIARAHLFSLCRFCVHLNYALLAILFATRPAIFMSIQAPQAPQFSQKVFQKHPLGSNILPFSEITKLDRDALATNSCNPSSASILRCRRDCGRTGVSRPDEKRQTHVGIASWLRWTVHGHCKSRRCELRSPVRGNRPKVTAK